MKQLLGGTSASLMDSLKINEVCASNTKDCKEKYPTLRIHMRMENGGMYSMIPTRPAF